MDFLFSFLLKAALVLIAIFMILLILVQRGRGGGLAGALGGPGGSSAFGTKAGDTFTRITSYTALIWMTVCIVASIYFSRGSQSDAFSAVDQQRAQRSAPAGSMGAGAESDEGATPPAAPSNAQTPAEGDTTAPAGDDAP